MTESRWDLIPSRRRVRRSVKFAVALALLAGLTPVVTAVSAVSAPTAGATHFRANQINWHTTPTAGEVEFHVTGSWRIGYFFSAPPSVGDTFSESCLNFGDGASDCPTFVVTSVDAANDVFSAEAHVSHVYAGVTPAVVRLSGCCRLSGPLHRNNPDGNVLLESVVNHAATSASPVSQVSPIVDCGLNSLCSFQVPATDSDGQGLRFRFAGANEAGSGFAQPFGAAIDATTGRYTWNTSGASLNTNGESFFSTQVVVENVVANTVVATTPVDFFIRVTDTPNLAPAFQAPTPADATDLTGTVGNAVTFGVAASDADTADTVTLSVLGVPSGATFTSTPGNPASGTFSWVPPVDGDTILTLLAQDQHGLGAVQRSITLRVDDLPPAPQAPPVFDAPTPAAGTIFGPLPVGSAFNVPLAASDPNAGDRVRLGFSSAAGGIMLQSARSNPTTGTLDLTAVAPGTHQITLTATDDHGNAAAPRTITAKITNAAPSFVAPTPNANTAFNAYRGTPLTIPLGVHDPDPDLRSLVLSIVSGPAGGSIGPSSVQGADGAFQWTPTTLGSFWVTVKVQDAWGASATRQFSLRVLNRAPEFVSPSPTAGEIFDVVATGRLDIPVKASDPDPENVRLATLSLPAGATYNYVGSSANPSQATLSWTPSTVGTHQVTLLAYDPQNLQAPSRAITIRVLHAPTALTAHPAVVRISPKPVAVGTNGVTNYDVYFPSLSAVLKTSSTAPQPNKALAGKTVKFYAGATFICQGTTDATGQAFCKGAAATSQAEVLLAQGYRAEFGGDTTYKAVSALGGLIQNTL